MCPRLRDEYPPPSPTQSAMERYKSIPRDVVNHLHVITYLILVIGHKGSLTRGALLKLLQSQVSINLHLHVYGPSNLLTTKIRYMK